MARAGGFVGKQPIWSAAERSGVWSVDEQYQAELAGVWPIPIDPDVLTYVAAVESADTQALEPAVIKAYNNFVVGCKTDGIWDAIKASCILAGARTLAGALVPLKGAAPTNVSGLFVSGDYNRETGLVGNGSTKRLNSNRSNSTDPQNSRHIAVYASSRSTVNNLYVCCLSSVNATGDSYLYASAAGDVNSGKVSSAGTPAGLSGTNLTSGIYAANRASSSEVQFRRAGSTVTQSVASVTPLAEDIAIYGQSGLFSNARLAFYSIGESLDLALLDTRVTNLVNAIAAAIP
jgi:hypothetical protein